MEVESEEKPLADSPLLMTEPGWNPVKAREKTIEIAMEKWGTPAFYLARSGVLAAYVSPTVVFGFYMPVALLIHIATVLLPVKPPLSWWTLVPLISPSPRFTTA
jgi:hypothetical protein